MTCWTIYKKKNYIVMNENITSNTV